MLERQTMIERLTGVQSSKRSYYTELKNTVAELQKKNMQLEIIHEVMKNLNVEMSMDDMLKNIMDKLITIFPFDRISLSIRNGDELVLSNVYPKKLGYLPRNVTLSKEHSLYWKVIEKGKMHFHQVPLEAVENEYIENQIFRGNGIESALLFPLHSKGMITGIVSIGSMGILSYDEADLAFLQQLADQFAVCLENVRLYNEVLNSQKEWEDTFRAVVDMIFVVDLQGTIVKVNEQATRFFHLLHDQLVGMKIQDVFHRVKDISNLLGESLQTKQASYREIRLPDNRIFETFSNPVFNEEQQMYGFILYMKEVSEKKRIESQLIHSGKLAAIGELAAGVAHELNNPLTAILGNSQLLVRDVKLEPAAHNLLVGITDCGKRCKNIVQNLLTFSRQEEYLFQACSLNEAVDQILSLVGYQIEMQNITITVKKDDTLPRINGSLQQLGQIVLNFVLNAKDALEQNGLRKKEIIIETSHDQEWVQLTVSDTGSGISAEHQSEIFHPFFTTKPVGQGTGLGLSVSLGIAQAHGGFIEMTSREGEGSSFMLRLPKIHAERT